MGLSLTQTRLVIHIQENQYIAGYCVFIEYSLASWKTKKQQIISRSSTEAEHTTMAKTMCELFGWCHC